jgi:hypothetical protein
MITSNENSSSSNHHILATPAKKAEESSSSGGEKEKRIKRAMIAMALLGLIVTLYKFGVHRAVLRGILKSRLMSWLLMMLFNYRLSTSS